MKGKHSFGIWMYWGRKAGLTKSITLFPSVLYFLSCCSHFSPFPSLLSWFLPVASLQSSLSLRAGICVQQTRAQLHSHLCSCRCNQQPSEQQHRHQQAHHSCLPASGTPHQTPHFLGRKMTARPNITEGQESDLFSVFFCVCIDLIFEMWFFFFFAHLSSSTSTLHMQVTCWKILIIHVNADHTSQSSGKRTVLLRAVGLLSSWVNTGRTPHLTCHWNTV